MPDRPFLFLRHGLTDWNTRGVFQGRTDVPLNALGVSQAQGIAKELELALPAIIVSSPLLRAAKTAEIISQATQTPLHLDRDLIECDFGSFEGRSISDVMLAHCVSEKPELASILPDDAEVWALVSQRALRCVERWQANYPGSEILFVCHDAVMQALAERLCGHWFENLHCVPYRLEPAGAFWSIAPYLHSNSQ